MQDWCHGVGECIVYISDGLFLAVEASGAGVVRCVGWALAGVAGVGGFCAVGAFACSVVVWGSVVVAGQGGYPFGHEKTRHDGRAWKKLGLSQRCPAA